MERKLYLVKLGEISLKGLNREFFERKLKDNIKYKLRPYHSHCDRQKGRLFFEIDGEAPDDLIHAALSTSFGVTGFSRALKCEKNMEAIFQAARILIGQTSFTEGKTGFKVETVRADKSFPVRSYDVSAELGGLVLDTFPSMHVDVKTPQSVLYVEIRDAVYLYTSPSNGLGGLPVGTSGRGLLMLSGGIDSPVAGYRMAKRGLRQEAVYFHAYPYTSDEAKQKVIALSRILTSYCSGITLHVVPFTDVQLKIKVTSRSEENTLLMRACMVKIANKIALNRNCQCIVTGESLAQVASQTLESLIFTDSMSEMTVFRPLIGMDKGEIIDTARKIGTYETSILPFEDCCTIFSPKHPLVRPDKQHITEAYQKMDIEALLDEAVAKTEIFVL
ncbi:MAG: tRNA uracil 4-sulfurtransferase ThiI [Sphaerochaetaceae bacterium]